MWDEGFFVVYEDRKIVNKESQALGTKTAGYSHQLTAIVSSTA